MRETLSTLQEEAASVSEKLAQSETRIQEARSAEADMQETAAQTSKQVADLEARKEDLTAAVSDLSTRRSDIQSDVSAAEEQRAKVQSELQDITQLLEARSDELVKVDSWIAEKLGGTSSTSSEAADTQAEAEGNTAPAQQDSDGASKADDDKAAATSESAKTSGETAQATAEEADATARDAPTHGSTNIAPGTYRTGDIEARFGSGGKFQTRNQERGTEVQGDYSAASGIVTLSNPKGDLRRGINFPLRCAVETDGPNFSLSNAGEESSSCGPLAGATFRSVQ